ncbi:unnamed protein product [Clonostachys rosea]|uniref:Uncharacterized protein n=1 Tax=Bionectria ochroleuca TaxID=29856 RepID=A0ABY6U493_BIOOC|nr:unnamed protein product [Clonostachys rosea]
MTSTLQDLLPPNLLRFVAEKWIPLEKKEPFANFGEALRKGVFHSDASHRALFHKTLWPTLTFMTKLDVENPPDWMALLPPVEDPEFPARAFGLQLILDQAPRVLFEGVNQRWVFAFFDELSIKYALALQDLPANLRPSSWDRWKDSVTFDYFLILRLYFGAPLVHHEKTAEAAVKFTEETRTLIEERFNVRDPIREQPGKRWDMYGFPKMISAGPPAELRDTASGGFWIQHLMDVHKPPLDKFGRYPYRNWVLGREMTAAEEEWIGKADYFKPPPEDSASFQKNKC